MTRVEVTESSRWSSDQASLEQLVIRNGSALVAQRVVERALSRSRRVELFARSVPPDRVASPRERPGLPPPLVLQRPAAAPQEPRPPAREGPPGRPPAQRDPITDAVDVGRLTDQVMSAIDGRLTAHAERLGRS
jgi:hypothetical protein